MNPSNSVSAALVPEGRTAALRRDRRVALGALAAMATIVALAFASVLVVTGGSFGYVLDDPYIHLSMAEQILRGEYGINPGEPAAAASSILYPYLLAGLMTLGVGDAAPLLVNLVSLAVTVWCLAAILDEVLGPTASGHIVLRVLLLVGFCLALKLTTLAFTGMENGVHTALSVAGLLGILRYQGLSRPPIWWLAVLVIAPLVRYEGLSLTVAGAAILVLNRNAALALALLATALLSLVGYSSYLVSLGLPPLPSSVLVKSAEAGVSGAGNIVSSIAGNAFLNLRAPDGVLLAICLAPLLVRLARDRGRAGFASQPDWQVALAAVILLAGQLVIGRSGSFADRYSTYALAFGVMAILVVHGPVLGPRLADLRIGRPGRVIGLSVLGAMVLWAVSLTGLAAGNIHFQQYQTHRFATEFWRAPIAVNDVGWPSYRNESYVLDLWGLGSERARRLRGRPDAIEGLAALVEERGVAVAAIYDQWFPERPPGWVPVARLKLDIPRMSASSDTVTFYATQARFAPSLRERLADFARTLPKGASLRFE